MAKIVFFSIPAHGHTNPTLGVVRELVGRGHGVWYYSYEPLREKIEAAGAKFVPCDAYGGAERLGAERASQVGGDLRLSVKLLVDTACALEEMVLRDMAALAPDCIVADSMAPWGKMAAQKLAIPYVCSTTTFAFNRHSAKIMPQSKGEGLKNILAMLSLSGELRRLRRRGYAVKSVLDLIGNDAAAETLVYTSREFQPRGETFPANYAFVGPVLRPRESAVEKTGEKLVYVSMGTVNNAKLSLYRSCIEALGNTPWQVILSVGREVSPAALGALGENIAVYPAVDQIAVLEKADLFLTHCGMNSVSEGLWFSVPLLMLPQTAEQGGVAARVKELGAGELLEREDAPAIRAAAERLLSTAAYRKSAAAIAEGFRRCGGAKAAADRILSCCKKG